MAHAATARPSYRPIADYGVIGDCESVALVATDGSIDWWCPRRFDAPSAFGAILDRERGGFFRVHAEGRAASSTTYLGRTNVLRTGFRSGHGQAELLDFMPMPRPQGERVGSTHPRLYRLVRVTQGEMDLAWEFVPRFGYGRVRPRFRSTDAQGVEATGAGVTLTLASSHPLEAHTSGVFGATRLTEGESLTFAVGYAPFAGAAPVASVQDAEIALRQTLQYWEDWTRQMRYRGPYEDLVARSALVLKLLTYAPTGAVLAAPTCSLPEAIGGVRNWDYRYSWVRDAAFTVRALHALGHDEEIVRYMDWLLRVAGEDPRDLRVLYGITGDHDLPERTLDHLHGYRGSRPVRVGNAAAQQFQLDVYGELVLMVGEAEHLGIKADGVTTTNPDSPHNIIDEKKWAYFRRLADFVADAWRRPDSGIWEVRSAPRHFVLSKAMAWAALSVTADLAERRGLPGDVDRWREEATACRAEALERGWSDRINSFRQAYDEDEDDASNLLLPLIGFVEPNDPRMIATTERIRDVLTVNGLVYRYLDADDGLPGHEATFAYCTFWLVEVLAMQGRLTEARETMDNLVKYASPLGLFAEEIDPVSGELLGNYPQGFPHIGLVSAAVRLADAERERAHRMERTATPS